MSRAIRITYRFTRSMQKHYEDEILVRYNIEPKTPINELKLAAASYALFMDTDEFIKLFGVPWTWTDDDWKKAGFDFEYCEEVI